MASRWSTSVADADAELGARELLARGGGSRPRTGAVIARVCPRQRLRLRSMERRQDRPQQLVGAVAQQHAGPHRRRDHDHRVVHLRPFRRRSRVRWSRALTSRLSSSIQHEAQLLATHIRQRMSFRELTRRQRPLMPSMVVPTLVAPLVLGIGPPSDRGLSTTAAGVAAVRLATVVAATDAEPCRAVPTGQLEDNQLVHLAGPSHRSACFCSFSDGEVLCLPT
jgi:hypothetical protein